MTDNLGLLNMMLKQHEDRMTAINNNHQQVMGRLIESENINMVRHEERIQVINQNHAQQMRSIQQSSGGLLGTLLGPLFGASFGPVVGALAAGMEKRSG